MPQSFVRYVGLVLTLLTSAAALRADIYQWAWVDPNDPSQGKYQSSVLCPGGAGVSAVPRATLSNRNLTQAYLIGADLSFAFVASTNLTDADFTGAIVNGTFFSSTNLTFPQLASTASYQAHDLSKIKLMRLNLAGWDLSGQDLTSANFSNSTLTNVNFAGATVAYSDFRQSNVATSQLLGTASFQKGIVKGIKLPAVNLDGQDFSGFDFSSADITGVSLRGVNLTSANLAGATMTSADLTGAIIKGANLTYGGITSAQLYATTSYINGELGAVTFTNADLSTFSFSQQNLTGAKVDRANLIGTDFAGANLSNVSFASSYLYNANFSQAVIKGAFFDSFGVTPPYTFSLAQLNSTASYQSKDLRGIRFNWFDLSNGNLAGQNLSGTVFYCSDLMNADLRGAVLTNASLVNSNFDSADLRGAVDAPLDLNNSLRNTIFPNGTINYMKLGAGEHLIIRNDNISILVSRYASTIDAAAALQFVFDGNPWGSTISFDSGTSLALAGTLDLAFADGVDPHSLAGETFKLFDWTGVDLSSEFNITSEGLPADEMWDTSKLYTTGEVTLVIVPEPATWAMVAPVVLGLAYYTRRKSRDGTRYVPTLHA